MLTPSTREYSAGKDRLTNSNGGPEMKGVCYVDQIMEMVRMVLSQELKGSLAGIVVNNSA